MLMSATSKSKLFYDALLGTLGVKPGISNHNGVVQRYFYRSPTGNFGITAPPTAMAVPLASRWNRSPKA